MNSRNPVFPDIPSHIVRENDVDGEDDAKERYTLTYSEGNHISAAD